MLVMLMLLSSGGMISFMHTFRLRLIKSFHGGSSLNMKVENSIHSVPGEKITSPS
jgi:hypothetical protein